MFWIAVVLAVASGYSPGWELVAYIDPYATVYVEDSFLHHTVENQRRLMEVSGDIRRRLIGDKSGPLVLDYFDNRRLTPTALPYNDSQKMHWQARVLFRYDGGVIFAWDPSEGKWKE